MTGRADPPVARLAPTSRVRRARPDDEAALLGLHLATWTSEVSPDGAPDPAALPDEGTALADVLAVAPDAQGRGHGRRLVEAALDEARARGARKVTLRVLARNRRARRLYEACGFVVEGVLREQFLLDGVLTDDLLLARALDEGQRPALDGRRRNAHPGGAAPA